MIRILKPNDFHHHLRDGNLLQLTATTCFQKFNHVVVMPNLVPPILTIDKAIEYRDRIRRPNFFLGTDSAPHEEYKKLSFCGCAGIFNSPVAVELVADLFDSEDGLDVNNFEKFVSTNGCDFYNLPYSQDVIVMRRKEWTVPEKYDTIVPLYAGKQVNWTYEESS